MRARRRWLDPTLADWQLTDSELEQRKEVSATMSVPEAAALLGVSRSTLYRAIDRGEITAIRIGRCTQVPRHVVEQLINEGNTTKGGAA